MVLGRNRPKNNLKTVISMSYQRFTTVLMSVLVERVADVEENGEQVKGILCLFSPSVRPQHPPDAASLLFKLLLWTSPFAAPIITIKNKK